MAVKEKGILYMIFFQLSTTSPGLLPRRSRQTKQGWRVASVCTMHVQEERKRSRRTSSEMLSTGVRRPCCALCGAGADVHCHADAAFLCAPYHAQVHCTSPLASRHRLTPPTHVRAEVTTRAMGLDPWAARLRAAAGRTRVPPPSDVHGRCVAAFQVLARRMGLDVGSARLRAAAAFRTLRLEFGAAAPRMPLHVAMASTL
uniref:Uncharacterized protein n=1 Tax=Aegilops tauschii TaxID=37682 RepID=M8BIX1_AEGTA